MQLMAAATTTTATAEALELARICPAGLLHTRA